MPKPIGFFTLEVPMRIDPIHDKGCSFAGFVLDSEARHRQQPGRKVCTQGKGLSRKAVGGLARLLLRQGKQDTEQKQKNEAISLHG